MLSPRYLDGLADDITEIYSQLETDILQSMAKRLARCGKVTESTEWQAKILAESGGIKNDIAKTLSKYDKTIQKQLTKTVSDALKKNTEIDNRIFSKMSGRTVSDPSAQTMLSVVQRCYSDLSRITQTTAMTTQTEFVKQANRVYMNTQSGAFDYNESMKMACDELADKGITAVQYHNSVPVQRTIESAVRMNILTSINRTAANISLNNCEELDCDLVEVSAHQGARPEHEEWQGKIYSRSGKSDKYPPFSICGLGEIDGLCGINCRHSFYPYFEGMEEHYTAEDLDELANEKVEYNGKELSRYEAEQEQRGIERKIRYYKRKAVTEEAGGVDNTKARAKLGEWQAKAQDFTQQTGLRRDTAREWIGTSDGKQPKGINITKNQTFTNSTMNKPTLLYGNATDLTQATNELKNFAANVNINGIIDVTNANRVTKTIEQLYKDLEYKNLNYIKTVMPSSKDNYAARACWNALEISKRFINTPADYWKTSFGKGFETYKETVKKNIPICKANIQIYNDIIKKMGKSIDKNKLASMKKDITIWKAYIKENEPLLPYSRTNVIYEGKEIESTITHELGHVIADQKTGQINHKSANPNFEYNKENELYKKVLMIDNCYKQALTNGDIYKISYYASSEPAEFFAECFAIHRMGVEKLPDYLETMVKEVIK